MERIVPWTQLLPVIEPLYPESGRVGRRPIGVPKLLRMYCLQQWYRLGDEALEAALYDSQVLRDFVGIDLSRESAPDASTWLKFRRLPQGNDLTQALFGVVNAHLGEQGLLMRAATIVDATIIAESSSTNDEDKARDPEMHKSKKGNQWRYGMKAHISVDAQSGRTVITTAANVNDVTQAGALLHGDEQDAFGDAGHRGVHRREEAQGPRLNVAMQSGERRQLDAASKWAQLLERDEQPQASIRAKVERPFHVIMNLFGHKKVRYKGLAKNEVQLLSRRGLANLVIAKRKLIASHTRGAS